MITGVCVVSSLSQVICSPNKKKTFLCVVDRLLHYWPTLFKRLMMLSTG